VKAVALLLAVTMTAACSTLAGPPDGWFERACEATRLLAEEYDIEDPEDAAVRNRDLADRALALVETLPAWEPGAVVVDRVRDAAASIRASSNAYLEGDFEAWSEELAPYFPAVESAVPAIATLAAEHGRTCAIEPRYEPIPSE